MSKDTTRLVAEIDLDLKRRAKADPRSIREIVEASLEREFATGDSAAIERRIEERQQRIQTLEREINERQRELANEKEELERLETTLSDFEGRQYDRLDEARDVLEGTPREPSNPAVKNWARKLGMTPHELLAELDEDTN